jgi:hypothetical protein
MAGPARTAELIPGWAVLVLIVISLGLVIAGVASDAAALAMLGIAGLVYSIVLAIARTPAR